MKHYVIAGVLTIVLTVILGLFLTNIGLMPVEASKEAIPVDAMINLQSWLIAFLFSLVSVFIVYSIVVFRRKPGQERTPAFFKSSSRLEIIWTLIPLATVIYLAFLGAKDLAVIKQVDPSALEVKVTAFQWGWIFQYPDLNIQSNVLYLPINKQVHFVMSSRDVIHSFWIPEMRIKQDVLPGDNLVKELRLTPDRVGDYKVRCAELCGGAHAYMEAPVKVVSYQDFQDWAAGQQGAANLSAAAKQGRDIANQTGCTGCHSIDGSRMAGPTWKGLAGSQQKLADGSTVPADDAYLHESIVDPNAKIVNGFPPNVMPQNYKSTLSEDQIKAIIEYIKALK